MVKCGMKDCKVKRANFNKIGEIKGKFCNKHKEENMINVKDPKCQICNDNKTFARYKLNEPKSKLTHCKKHKEKDMIPKKQGKGCAVEGCIIKNPTYNIPTENKGLYCLEHKLNDMVNVITKTCIIEECGTHPSFNYENIKTPIYCIEHILDGMVNVVSKNCIYLNCGTRPIFNYENEKTAIYCQEHKLDNMINIRGKTCIIEDCKTHPVFNYENEIKALYCGKHKLDNMINIWDNNICIFINCGEQCYYNYKNEKIKLYCFKHKLDNMIHQTHATCIFENCITQSSFNYENEKKPLYCKKHKLDNMEDILTKTCNNDWCKTQVKNKYEGYCRYCFINMFPEKSVARNYKTKEYSVVEYIKHEFPNVDLKCDKQISDGCSRRRPDILLDLGNQVIIIEIDENQHNNYDCSCEHKRLMELSQDLNHRPIIFIRFNPDNYKENNKNITSCWGLSKKGISIITKCDEWKERLLCLKNQIEYWLIPENETDKMIEIIELYYDNNNITV